MAQDLLDRLEKLAKLRAEGILSEDEFASLKETIIFTKIAPPDDSVEANVGFRNEAPPNSDKLSSGAGFAILISILIGVVLIDHIRGPIFPDNWYCAVGAGTLYTQAGRTHANEWSTENGCGAYKPGCELNWVHEPAASRCVHGTLWRAIWPK